MPIFSSYSHLKAQRRAHFWRTIISGFGSVNPSLLITCLLKKKLVGSAFCYHGPPCAAVPESHSPSTGDNLLAVSRCSGRREDSQHNKLTRHGHFPLMGTKPWGLNLFCKGTPLRWFQIGDHFTTLWALGTCSSHVNLSLLLPNSLTQFPALCGCTIGACELRVAALCNN